MSTIHRDLRGLFTHVALGVGAGSSPQGGSCPVTHKITKRTVALSSAAQIINFCSDSHLTAFTVITRRCSDSANRIMREVITLLAYADGVFHYPFTRNICQKRIIIKFLFKIVYVLSMSLNGVLLFPQFLAWGMYSVIDAINLYPSVTLFQRNIFMTFIATISVAETYMPLSILFETSTGRRGIGGASKKPKLLFNFTALKP
jgi:hypothetical protein